MIDSNHTTSPLGTAPDAIANDPAEEAPWRDETAALLLGRYRLRRNLAAGAGEMGYEAWDERLGRKVELKVVQGAPRAGFAQAQVLASLKHQNLVTVYDAAWAGEALVIVMEYVEGVSLTTWLAEAPRLEARRRALADVGEALGAIHAAGVTHGKLSSAHIFIDKHGAAKVGDVGMATLARATAEPTRDTANLAGQGAAADVWAYAGVVLEAHGFAAPPVDDAAALAGWRDAALAMLQQRGELRELRGPARRMVQQILSSPPGARPSAHGLAAALTTTRTWRMPVLLSAVAVAGLVTYGLTSRHAARVDPLAACFAEADATLQVAAPSAKVRAALLAIDQGGPRGREIVERFDALHAAAQREMPALGRQACQLPPAKQREMLPCVRAARDAFAMTLAKLEAGLVPDLGNVSQLLRSAASVDECRLEHHGRQLTPTTWLAARWAEYGRLENRLSAQALRGGDPHASLQHARKATLVSELAGYYPGVALGFVRQAYATVNASDIEAGKALAHQAIIAGERAGDVDAIVVARTLRANLAMRTGKLDEAKAELAHADAMLTRWESPQARAMLATVRASVLCADVEVEACLKELDVAVALSRKSAADIAQTLEIEMLRVGVLAQAHRYIEGAAAGREVYAAHQAAFGTLHPYTLEAGATTVFALTQAGQFQEAKQILSELVTALPPGANELAVSIYQAQALLAEAMGDAPTAFEGAKRVLAMRRALFGADSVEIIKVLDNAFHSGVEVDAGEALAYAEEGEQLARRHYGAAHPTTAKFVLFRKVGLAKLGRFREANALGTQMLERMLKTPNAAAAHFMEAGVQVAQGRWQAAAGYYAKGLTLVDTPTWLGLPEERLAYADVLLQLHQPDAAKAQVEAALAALRPAEHEGHARLAAACHAWLVKHAHALPATRT